MVAVANIISFFPSGGWDGGNPTDYNALYTGLMVANNITIQAFGPIHLTVMTIGMQLYHMVMKLWVEREDSKDKFLFRPGEIHVDFWSLAVLGKYIEGSGIDQVWSEADFTDPQILE